MKLVEIPGQARDDVRRDDVRVWDDVRRDNVRVWDDVRVWDGAKD